MAIEQVQLKVEDYHRALILLQAALEKDVNMDDMYLV